MLKTKEKIHFHLMFKMMFKRGAPENYFYEHFFRVFSKSETMADNE